MRGDGLLILVSMGRLLWVWGRVRCDGDGLGSGRWCWDRGVEGWSC